MLPMSRLSLVRRARVPASFVLVLVLAAGLALLAGCGGKKDDGGVLLATVGGTEIRSGYYEDRLGRLTAEELPRDDQGEALDMASPEGKSEFLTTLINKELLVQKGRQLGYADDPRIVEARKSLIAYEASLAMWRDVVGDPANELSHAEVDAIYDNLGQQRRISYVICDFEEDAKAAREMALGGADWEDVISRYHSGAVPENGKLEMFIPFGRFDLTFEEPIFAVEVGGVSQPISTEYGWWVVRVEGVKQVEKPSREDAMANILDLTRNRKITKLRGEFQKQVRARYKLTIEDEALVKAYAGLPTNEPVLDPATNQPVPQDQLLPLTVAPADLDLPFYSYVVDDVAKRYTLGDYKIKFDRMNTFQRPKKSAMLGGLRASIAQELERALMDLEARRLGFYEDPEVLALVDIKIEEMIVTALYGEIVTFDERVTPEQLEAFWAEHQAEYVTPENRTGRLLIAADEAKAAQARGLLAGGAAWGDIVAKFGTDDNNRKRSGQVDEVRSSSTGPVRDAFYALEPGQTSEPFPVGDGRYGLVRLDNVVPAKPMTMVEASQMAGQRIKADRKEAAFQALLADWAAEFGVDRHDDNLSQVKSWKELTHVEAPGPAVPRNQ